MIAGLIQARIGSHRCRNKMLRNFASTNLISLALKKFTKSTKTFKLYFAAYEPELVEIGQKYNCAIIKRNEESARDDRIEVVMNYFSQISEDTILFINSCHPFLTLETLERAVKYFEEKKAKSMTAVVKSHTWYYYTDGRAINFLDPTNINTKTTEPLFQVTHAFHIFNKNRFIKHHYFWTHNENDPCFFEMPENESIDIDTELDFEIAEALYIRKNKCRTSRIYEKLAKIKMLVMDVDGVLTDAGMYYSQDGDELKKFNTRDAMGIKLLKKAGIDQAIITGEDTSIVLNRAKKMKIDEVHLGVEDKVAVFDYLLSKYSIKPENVVYIGDDVNDISVMKLAGFSVAVYDAAECVRDNADYVTRAKGGCGAVREICDMILKK